MAEVPFWVKEGFEQLKVGWLLHLSTSELNRPEAALRYFEATLLPGAKRFVDQLAKRPSATFPKPEQWDQWKTYYVSRWKGSACLKTAAPPNDYEKYLSDYLSEIAASSAPARPATTPPTGLPRITDLALTAKQFSKSQLLIAAALADWRTALGETDRSARLKPKREQSQRQAEAVRAECDSAVSGIRTSLGRRAFPLPILRWEPTEAEARNLKKMARLVDRCSAVIGQLLELDGAPSPEPSADPTPPPNSAASIRLKAHLDQWKGWPCWTLAGAGIDSDRLAALTRELEGADAELQTTLADSGLRKSLSDEVVSRLLIILALLCETDRRHVPHDPCVSRLLDGSNWKGEVHPARHSPHSEARTGFSLISRDGSTFVIRARQSDDAASTNGRDDVLEALDQAGMLVAKLVEAVGDDAEARLKVQTILERFQPVRPDLFNPLSRPSISESPTIPDPVQPKALNHSGPKFAFTPPRRFDGGLSKGLPFRVSTPEPAPLPEDLVAWRDLPALDASTPAASGLSEWHALILRLPSSLDEVRDREESFRKTFTAWMQTEEARPWYDSAVEAWKTVLISKQWIRLIPEIDAEGNAWWPRGVSTIPAEKVIWKLRQPDADKRKRIEAKGVPTPFAERAEGMYNAGPRTHAPLVNAAEAVLGKAQALEKTLGGPAIEAAERLLLGSLDSHINETSLVDPFKSIEPLFDRLNGFVANRPPSETFKPLDDLLHALRDWCAIQGLWITPRPWTFEAGIPAEELESLPARFDENSDKGTTVVTALGLAWQAPEGKPPGLPESKAFRSAGRPPEYLDMLETALRDWKQSASAEFLRRLDSWPGDEWGGGGQFQRTAVKFFTDFRDVNDKSDAYHKAEEALGRLLSARFGLDLFHPDSLSQFGPRTANVRNSRTSHRSEIREVISPGLRIGDDVWVPAEVDVYE